MESHVTHSIKAMVTTLTCASWHSIWNLMSPNVLRLWWFTPTSDFWHGIWNLMSPNVQNKSFHCTICFIWKKHSTLISKLTYEESLITFKHHQVRSNFLSHSCKVCICDVNNRLSTEISFCKLLVYISASIKKTH